MQFVTGDLEPTTKYSKTKNLQYRVTNIVALIFTSTVCLLFKDTKFQKTKTQGEMVEIERGGPLPKLSCGRPKQKRPIRVMIIHLRIYTTTPAFF